MTNNKNCSIMIHNDNCNEQLYNIIMKTNNLYIISKPHITKYILYKCKHFFIVKLNAF